MKHVTTFNYKNNVYEVIKDNDGFYWAFNEKYIDEDGRLTKQFNGITGHRNDNVNDTLIAVMNEVDIEKWDAEHDVDSMDMTRLLAMKEIIETNMAKFNRQ